MGWRSEYCYEPGLSRRHRAKYVWRDPERLVLRYLVLRVGQGIDAAGELEDLDVVWTLVPIMAPTHNDVAPG
jgi:hypothetical protein